MSEQRSLPDELRSVLLEHSFEAPDGADTMTRILAATVDQQPIRRKSRGRPRRGTWLTAAAAVVVVSLGGLGIAKLQQDHAASTGAKQQSDSAAAGSADFGQERNGAAVRPNVSAGQENGASSVPCVTAILGVQGSRISTGSGDGAGVRVVWRNDGPAACTFTGYPTAQLLDAAGHPVGSVTRTGRGRLGGVRAAVSAPPALVLKAGQSASAVVEWATVPAAGAVCVEARQVRVGIGSSAATVPVATRQCDAQVHPVVAGVTGSD